jgi:hypothetical protein
MVTASRKRLVLWTAIALPALYLLCFLPLWLGGGYVATAGDGIASFSCFPTGLPAPTAMAEWQPLAGRFQPASRTPVANTPTNCDWIGWTWYPLLSLVRSHHPAVYLLNDRGFLADPLVLPPNFRVHPLRGASLTQLLGSAPAAGK